MAPGTLTDVERHSRVILSSGDLKLQVFEHKATPTPKFIAFWIIHFTSTSDEIEIDTNTATE